MRPSESRDRTMGSVGPLRRRANLVTKWQELGPEYPGVRVQTAQVGGRRRIVGIQVQNPDGVLHDQLRSVPVTQLEAKMNKAQASGAHWTLPEAGSWPPPQRRELVLDDKYFENPDGRGYGPA